MNPKDQKQLMALLGTLSTDGLKKLLKVIEEAEASNKAPGADERSRVPTLTLETMVTRMGENRLPAVPGRPVSLEGVNVPLEQLKTVVLEILRQREAETAAGEEGR